MVELEAETGLPSGARVQVDIEEDRAADASTARWVQELCGVWRDQPDIPGIFDEIARQRRENSSRPVDLDASS